MLTEIVSYIQIKEFDLTIQLNKLGFQVKEDNFN